MTVKEFDKRLFDEREERAEAAYRRMLPALYGPVTLFKIHRAMKNEYGRGVADFVTGSLRSGWDRKTATVGDATVEVDIGEILVCDWGYDRWGHSAKGCWLEIRD